MKENYELLFEYTIRTFLGDAASGIAGSVHIETSKKKWYRKTLKKIIRKVQEIETTTLHKQFLSQSSEAALDTLNARPYNERIFTLHLLQLIANLLGLVRIVQCNNIATPAYFQTPGQHHNMVIQEGGDSMQFLHDKECSLKIRKKLINQMKKDSLSDYKVSLVLNITEYQVKKLLKEQ